MKAFPDYRKFLQRAAAFERLGLNSAKRRSGFSAFAPETEFPAIWGKQKELIAAMSHRKCVYCEGPINAPRAAHVEHFKPKSLFPSLAYEWANYFLGCPGCNVAKSDKWPARGGYIRPDRGDPGRNFVFAEDGTVEAAVSNGRAERMLRDFDLKRRWLSDQRQHNIQTMLKLLEEAAQLLREGHEAPARRLARTLLETVDAPEAAYSVALTQCFWRAWNHACPGGKV